MSLVNVFKEKMRVNIKSFINQYRKFRKLKISFFEMKEILEAGYGEVETAIFGKEIKVNSAFWYLHGLEELFLEETYKFHSAKPNPVIIDCGANTGLSVIYFKTIFPDAKITAFEPDVSIFKILHENLKNFGYADVELVNKAVWSENGSIRFLASGGVGGRISNGNDLQSVEMRTARLSDLLNKEVDFLKIDIEGAEFDVINDCKDKLDKVKHIFIEYHSEQSNEQKLDEILKILKNSGFKYYIKEAWNNQPKPYTNKRENLFDLQLNIFGYRLEK